MIFKINNIEDFKCFKFSICGDDYYIRVCFIDYVNMGYYFCLVFEVLKEVGMLEYLFGVKCLIGLNCILIYCLNEFSLIKLFIKFVLVCSNEKYFE